MTKSRVVIAFALVTTLAAGVLIISPSRFFLLLLALVIGVGLGLYIRPRKTASVGDVAKDEKNRLSEFSAELIATVNEMREGLLVINSDMRVVASNRAAQDLFSLLDASINSRRLTELTRNPAIYDAFLDAVRGRERTGVKVETFGPERKVFDLRVVPLSSKNDEISGAVGVFFDVTRLERLEVIRQEFLSNVSHELRTPLTSIMALAETLENGAIDDQENNRRFLTIIQKNAVRMHRLIDDILELSAIEAGNVRVLPEVIALHPLVEEVIGSLSAFAASRKVTTKNLVDLQTEVFADPHRLTQMLTNLIDNAIKFNSEAGTVTIKHERHRGDRISVEDSGEGIPAHHLDRLFERFYRVDRARSRELGGTGLGLAIVKHLAKAHGGEVSVESRFGEGTRFSIELPSAREAQARKAKSTSA